MHHATAPRQGAGRTWFQIKRPHRHCARHRDRVRSSSWYPHRAMCGHDPCAFCRANRHHSAGRVNKLVPIMKMQRGHLPRPIVVSQSRDMRVQIAGSIKNCILALLRHPLAQYRKHARPARATLGKSNLKIESGAA